MKTVQRPYIKPFHILLFITMSSAFTFGFLDLFLFRNFERLHIFLFNLTSGGFSILHLTECREKPSRKTYIFLTLSVIYAVCAFMEYYMASIALSLALAGIAEWYRHTYLSFIPSEFFRVNEKTSRKFHHASLLCLELALILSALVIANEIYFNAVKLEKLKLDMFFLGFSFPVSLITFHLIFKIIEKNETPAHTKKLSHFLFWAISGGVGVFFIFIIFRVFEGEIVSAFFLFSAVAAIFTIFFRHGIRVQQKHFLVSGMYFLLISSLSGLLYIVLTKLTPYEHFAKPVMRVHAFFSLYGWNLSGMLVILRWRDFPLKMNTGYAIYMHWAVIILAPFSKYFREISFVTVPLYMAYIFFFFFSKNRSKNSVII